ncbi:MAG TPA: dTDP-4-dehydrorhamnose reductase [Candidatus Acidoferrales bacterium]|nr:dTDP-4-dehydrorhamnose reductase [Candidatus Acidoferrales bacterium]
MKPTILLIGTSGQVGRELHKMLPGIGDVTALDRQRLDLTQPDEIRRTIRTIHPQFIVNAAGYTAVDKAESEESVARAINAVAPGVMAEEAKKIGAALIHYSTDYVFDGRKTSPYEEDDPPNPLNAYGRTKLEGERAIRASGAAHLIFRTTWVYAAEGKNFLLTILRLATQREELKIVHNQVGAPTLNVEIARATTDILAQFSGGGSAPVSPGDVSGVYHLTAGGQTTWYDFTNAILERAAKIPADIPWFAAATNHLPLVVRRVIPIAASEYPLPATRPAYSVLSNSRLNRTFSLRLPDWQNQLDSVFALQPAKAR